MAQGKENLAKRSTQRSKRESFVGIKEPQRRPLTIPQAPKFATSRRQSGLPTPTSRASSADSNTRRGPAAVVDVALAQSTDILRKGLRSEEPSHSSGRRDLTMAEAPRFATSARHGEKLSAVRWRETATLASSTRFLQTQLRGEDPSLMKKRELKLTVPETPKFHETKTRARPKSTAELEEEMMEQLNSRPFKARPYRPQAPIPVAAVRRPSVRPPTTFEPFHLMRIADHLRLSRKKLRRKRTRMTLS